MMQSITFTCETITPMFLSGADGVTPELRPPSIKGALRFWWRAVNGHLSLEELARIEGEIFGDTEKRSCFTIRITNRQSLTILNEAPVPHKNYKIPAIQPKTQFEISFLLQEKKIANFGIFDLGKLKSLVELYAILGDIGKRSRRAMGAFKILNSNVGSSTSETYPSGVIDLNFILNLMKIHSPHYSIVKDSIFLTTNSNMQPYPWIKQIQIGEEKDKEIHKITSNVTHEMKGKHGEKDYEPNFGHATGKWRFASPVYVSVLENNKTAIVTTFNTIPDKGYPNKFIQDEFKNKIL